MPKQPFDYLKVRSWWWNYKSSTKKETSNERQGNQSLHQLTKEKRFLCLEWMMGFYLLFGGRWTLICWDGDSRTKLDNSLPASGWLKQEGQPFSNLGPQVSPNASSWITQVQIKAVVIARIIHSLDFTVTQFLKFWTLLSPKIANPILLNLLCL